jgi:hypothetical protein
LGRQYICPPTITKLSNCYPDKNISNWILHLLNRLAIVWTVDFQDSLKL